MEPAKVETVPQCLFCRIVRGEIPASVVLETPSVLVFLDIAPVNKGHLLIVPKVHHSDLLELSEELAAETAKLVPKLAVALKQATNADGLNLIVNNGEAAGQTVGHGHWHLIPRFRDDSVHWPWPHSQYQLGEADEMQSQILSRLSS